ncbi:MAG TPA: hypothetical protein VGO21_02300 [Candidatus Paceibacterota bacterium]|nr:hypothetical protein [Candidatus Paceibacterota bacterium]
MEYKTENRICKNCKKDFIIEPNDFGFYEKIKVPPPTFCPECRRQRRWAWKNNMSLYSRKCDLCEKSIISIYSPDSPIKVYCNKCWWSDKWDPKSYGVEYDFSKPFFSQFKDLIEKVPHMAIVNDDGIASLNCEYTHDWWFSKNCYMCLSGWYVENVMYSFFILAGRDIMDCMNIRSKNEWLYECIICANCYELKYSQYCTACINSEFMYYSANCQDCFMCVGLVNKKYCFKNKQYTKEEYEKILEEYRLDTLSGVEKAQKEFNDFLPGHFRRYSHILKSINCTGETISYSKNCKNCFVAKKSENCSYCDFISGDKDSYDLSMSGEVSESYDSVVADHSQLNFFGVFSVKSQDVRYTQHCHNCKYLFGCVGLRNDSYSIFNKKYTKEKYEELVPKIIKHMQDMPYIDKKAIKYSYGEFYPIELSIFGYNETNAPELVPLSKEEVKQIGYNWQDNMQRTTGKETLLPENIPDSINNIDESILNEILICTSCRRNYKIVPNELLFYKKMKIPIPKKCFFCRHNDRIKKRNPFKLWHRACMCQQTNHFHGNDTCKVEFETFYAPDQGEIVYCEKCYQAEVY